MVSGSGSCRVTVRSVPVMPAEEGDRRRRAPVAGGLEADEVQRQRVARLGALDVERAGLRVDEAQVDLLAGQVGDAAQRAAEGVLGPQPQRRARA